ncbi:hypothetical protein [Jiella pacifica]|uniref:Uncharacterized protein n=1 Tax=Jiella pacifica TaxID=2696469 RepID=A0A6N9T1Z3_9HYPH|nr:hypothetical protein [Jiella pacifica]NDW04195.1 hypothetical protein [Jiella pacifica]
MAALPALLHDDLVTACMRRMAVLEIACFLGDVFQLMCGASKSKNVPLEFRSMHRSRLTAIAMDHVALARVTGRGAVDGEAMRRPQLSVMKTLGIDTPFIQRAR